MSEKYLMVGLGNPGVDYEYTRHNIGFLILKYVAEKQGAKFKKSSLTKGFSAEFKSNGNAIHLLLPSTYMNNSGAAVKPLMDAESISQSNMLVVADDYNLNFGQIRLRKKGSDGGHNGLKSIIDCLQSNDFPRLRIGIGQPKRKEETVDFVLEEFSKKEKDELDHVILNASECCHAWVNGGTEEAMNQFNRKKENE